MGVSGETRPGHDHQRLSCRVGGHHWRLCLFHGGGLPAGGSCRRRSRGISGGVLRPHPYRRPCGRHFGPSGMRGVRHPLRGTVCQRGCHLSVHGQWPVLRWRPISARGGAVGHCGHRRVRFCRLLPCLAGLETHHWHPGVQRGRIGRAGHRRARQHGLSRLCPAGLYRGLHCGRAHKTLSRSGGQRRSGGFRGSSSRAHWEWPPQDDQGIHHHQPVPVRPASGRAGAVGRHGYDGDQCVRLRRAEGSCNHILPGRTSGGPVAAQGKNRRGHL